MGTWGISAWENDMAQDWVAPITKSRIRQRVTAALRRVQRHGMVDSDVASIGLAACELIASASGHGHSSQPETVASAVYGLSQGDLGDLRADGMSSLDRISSAESALAQLWDESGQGRDWSAYVSNLRSRLASPVTTVPQPPKTKRQRRSKLGDIYVVTDDDLGYGYFQFVAKTKDAAVVLVLKEWYATPLDIEHLRELFGRWTEAGFLDRTVLPPLNDESSKLLGTFDVPSQAHSTIWMRVATGWITRDYVDPEPYRSSYRDDEFFQLHPEINEEMLAPWPIKFSIAWYMKDRARSGSSQELDSNSQ
jgi:hypothetical protein